MGGTMQVAFKVWLDNNGKVFGEGVLELLEEVEKTGSLHRAAMDLGMSYRTAWSMARKVEKRLGVAILNRRAGGLAGGGSQITQEGRNLMERYRAMNQEFGAIIQQLYRKHFGNPITSQETTPTLRSKITVDTLPSEGGHDDERRFVSPKGEMAQILNRPYEPYYHLAYWDLDTPSSGQERGHHYHAKKVEYFYILTGKVDFILETLDKTERLVISLEAGQRITLQPGVAHAFRSKGYAQVVEYSPAAYDPTDTYPQPVG